MEFYQQIHTNAIVAYNQLSAELKQTVPEGAIYFEGIVSDGNKNRNWYIIEQNAWFKNPEYISDFLASGSVLWNHDSDKPIGRPLSFYKTNDGKIAVSGYVFDDVHTGWAIGRKLVLGLSTWHITVDSVYRDEDGNEKTESEYWRLPISEILSDKWTWTVTNAEICEFSFTPTRSNRASVLANKIQRYAEHFKKDPTEVTHLFSNHIKMEKNEQENEAPEVEVVVTETPPEAEVTEIPAEEVIVEAPVTEFVPEANSIEKVTDAITLHNHIKAMRDNHVSEIENLKNSLEEKYKADLITATNALRDEKRESLAVAVGANSTTVKTPADFKAKYFSN